VSKIVGFITLTIGVTVYRGDSGPVMPPAAHTGVVVTATHTAGIVQTPTAVIHGPPQTVTAIKPENISEYFNEIRE